MIYWALGNWVNKTVSTVKTLDEIRPLGMWHLRSDEKKLYSPDLSLKYNVWYLVHEGLVTVVIERKQKAEYPMSFLTFGGII